MTQRLHRIVAVRATSGASGATLLSSPCRPSSHFTAGTARGGTHARTVRHRNRSTPSGPIAPSGHAPGAGPAPGAERERGGRAGCRSWLCGHDTGKQQPRAEPAVEEEGVLPDLPEPSGGRDLLQADDALHPPVDDPHGKVERDRKGRDILRVQEAGEPDGGIVQALCDPEHFPGLLSLRHPVDRDRNLLSEDDHRPGGREELQHRCPVRPGEGFDADPCVDADSFVLKERLDIHPGTSPGV